MLYNIFDVICCNVKSKAMRTNSLLDVLVE